MSREQTPSKWLSIVSTIGVFALVGVGVMLVHWVVVERWATWEHLPQLAMFFVVPGAIYGVAASLDARSPRAHGDHPVLRTVISSVLGGVGVLVVWSWFPENFHPIWASSGAVVGAIAGWFGWAWAKHVRLH
jgi:hypothetical protein